MHYGPNEFADLAGVSVKALHRWDSSGKLKPLRTIGGHRYYTDEHINQIKGIVKNPRINVIYCRVSSNAQKSELSNQAEAMKEFCTANGITIDKVIKEIQPLMGDVLGNAMPDLTGPSLPIPSKTKLVP